MGAGPSRMLATTESSLTHPPQRLPASHATVASFILALLPQPSKLNDVHYHYHTPHTPASLIPTSHIVLSITPTPGFYTALHRPGTSLPLARPLAFLHRPWTLDRRGVPKGCTVLASHTGFDEVLTVGWNTALAARLDLNVGEAVCLKGYKGDAERKIGLLAGYAKKEKPVTKDAILGKVSEEFKGFHSDSGGTEEVVEVFDYTMGVISDNEALLEKQDNVAEQYISAVAIMNAFGPDEVQRVADAASTAGLLTAGGKILYLTGQPRVPGLEAAKSATMLVVCVGHRAAEEWGVRYIASRLRQEFPGLDVEEVYEEEVKRGNKSSITTSPSIEPAS